MRRLAMAATTAAALVAVAAVAAAPAQAGAWATAGLRPLPEGIDAGETWTVVLTIRQHGVTPMDGLEPAVVIWPDRPGGDAERERFPARPAGTPGVYRADVVFPAAGRWAYHVEDGFLPVPHTYAPVAVGGVAVPPPPRGRAAAAPAGGEGAWTAVAVAGAALTGLAAAAGIALGARRRAPARRQRAARLSPRTSAR